MSENRHPLLGPGRLAAGDVVSRRDGFVIRVAMGNRTLGRPTAEPIAKLHLEPGERLVWAPVTHDHGWFRYEAMPEVESL